jgi:hypothetical protein
MIRNLREQADDFAGTNNTDDYEISPPPDSVDDQIDALIIRYEKESIESGEESAEQEKMLESLAGLSLRFLLEQDEEDPNTAPPAGSETPKKDPKPPEEVKPPIDIDLFTKKVARLAMNAQSLLQIEEVILTRSEEFLRKNYGQNYVDEMHDILDRQYDIGGSEEKDLPEVPIAAGAGTKSAGG